MSTRLSFLIAVVILMSLSPLLMARSKALSVDRDTSRCQEVGCALGPPVHLVQSGSTWRPGRSTIPGQKETFASITKTANTQKSDPDFAGLTIRCGSQGKIDVLLVLIRPLPPQTQPRVTIGGAAQPRTLDGTMTAAGAAVQLPEEAGALAGSVWQLLPSLAITVKDGTDEIKGVVDLDGLGPAYANLMNSCSQ